MATKKETRDDPTSCWNEAQDHEPVFVLRGRDPIAATVVAAWAEHYKELRSPMLKFEQDKYNEARRIARDMEAYARKELLG